MRLVCFSQLKPEKGIAYTRRHLQRLAKTGKFPAPVPLSEARIAWVEKELDDWIAARVADRTQKQAA